jgi:ABC-type antimicrobial peptide transport system permease subunit
LAGVAEPTGMQVRSVGYTLAAGIAVALAVGAAVTELVAPTIEFSVFVGIPAGLAAGLAAGAFVALGIRDPARRRPALALVSFGGVFLLALVVGILLDLSNSEALVVATLAGLLAAAASAIR